mmetsp:Transcript_147342/g.257499  ORF Transcript_147342/g.257499 Transcript_147342/m.257499 type:complete len:84 (+) Transcript_147342:3243-3494(+)
MRNCDEGCSRLSPTEQLAEPDPSCWAQGPPPGGHHTGGGLVALKPCHPWNRQRRFYSLWTKNKDTKMDVRAPVSLHALSVPDS